VYTRFHIQVHLLHGPFSWALASLSNSYATFPGNRETTIRRVAIVLEREVSLRHYKTHYSFTFWPSLIRPILVLCFHYAVLIITLNFRRFMLRVDFPNYLSLFERVSSETVCISFILPPMLLCVYCLSETSLRLIHYHIVTYLLTSLLNSVWNMRWKPRSTYQRPHWTRRAACWRCDVSSNVFHTDSTHLDCLPFIRLKIGYWTCSHLYNVLHLQLIHPLRALRCCRAGDQVSYPSKLLVRCTLCPIISWDGVWHFFPVKFFAPILEQCFLFPLYLSKWSGFVWTFH
jgi:hypothetical protein